MIVWFLRKVQLDIFDQLIDTKWLNLSYKSVQGTSIHGVSKIIWGFIIVKHIHS